MFKKLVLITLLAFSSQVFAQVTDPTGSTPQVPSNLPSDVKIPNGVELPKTVTVPQNSESNSGSNNNSSENVDLVKPSFEDTIIKKTQDSIKVSQQPLGIFGHDYLRKTDFKLFDKSNKVKIDDSYVLGHGDELVISIWNQEDVANNNFTISKDGYVELGSEVDPITGESLGMGIGRLYLAGVSFGKAKQMLKSKYRASYVFRDEDFDVSLSGVKNINVEIIGQVETPGSYKLPAINTVYNALMQSGGPTANGSVRRIEVKRNGRTIQTLDVYNYLLKGDARQNIYLQDNDVIFVPQIGKLVQLEGAVVRPMRFELKSTESFVDLETYFGGFLPNAELADIELYRFENDEYVKKSVNYKKGNPSSFKEQLINGDIIKVDELRRELLEERMVNVKGAVNEPNKYLYRDGMRVSDLIEDAKGLSFDAVTSRAYLVRLNEQLQKVNIPIQLDEILEDENSDQNIKVYPLDQLTILSQSQFAEEFSVQIFGQVKKPGTYTFGSDLTLQDLLIMSGGFKTQSLTSEIEVRRVIDYNDEDQRLEPVRNVIKTLKVDYNYLNPDNPDNRFEIMPMDQIFVRKIPDFERPKVVKIEGEVKYPGFYPLLTKNTRVSDLIEAAGGLTPYSYQPGAKMYRRTDSVVVVKDTVLVDTLMTVNERKSVVKVDKLHLMNLKEVMARESSKYNYVLKAGDVIKVPTIDETVSIEGAIRNRVEDMNIVNTAYRGNKNAKWYIDEFGSGFDKKALKRSTQVIYPNGQSNGTRKFLFFNVYPEVEPGSDIIVDFKPEKEDKDKNGFFEGLTAEKAITLFSAVGGVVGLILAAKK